MMDYIEKQEIKNKNILFIHTGGTPLFFDDLGDFEMTNILLLSVGTRNKVIQYFKKEFAGVGNVVVTDLTEIAPAIYEADKHYQVPRIIEDGYIDLILNICKKEQISGVLSLIDPELSLIAKIRRGLQRLA